MNRFLAIIIILSFFQSGYAQNRIGVNYLTDTQASYNLNHELELNTKFKVSENGFASKIRLLNINDETGAFIVKVFKNSENNNSLVAGPYVWIIQRTTKGWREFEFPVVIPVLKDDTYTLSISENAQRNNSNKSSNSTISYSDTQNPKITNTKNPVNNLLKEGRFNCVILIMAYHKLTAGNIGQAQKIKFNTRPDSLRQYRSPSGGTGTYAYQWQSSNDSINWTDISGANQVSYCPPPLKVTIWYRLNVTSGNFITETSNSVLIKVYPELIACTIGNSQTLCYNTAPASLNEVSLPSGGTGSYIYQWQNSRDSITWTDIPGASFPSYSPPSLTASTWYRLDILSGYSVKSNKILIEVNPELISGTIGQDQTICYNSAPDTLVQISAPSGGTGAYRFQWQKSSDNLSWTDINDGHSANLLPPSLSEVTWFRRTIVSGCTANSNSVKIALYQRVNAAQLYDNKTMYENTSTTFKVDVSGGTPPYTINYAVNGVPQQAITNYTSGTDLSTGVLKAGTYVYSLTSVNDKNGCSAQSLGRNVTETVLSYQVSSTNKALIVVNSASTSYSDYVNYISPYLDNFGIPYDVCNVNTTSLPSFNDYAVIVFGHKNVYSSGYPIASLEQAVSGGVGLYSFDPHLFDYTSKFNTTITQRSVSYNIINISNTTHYITKYHTPDTYNSTNNMISLLNSFTLVQKSNLTGGIDLAVMSSGGQTVSLLQITNYGNGKVVKWGGYDWVFESILGPVYGMDDLLWRSIIWAARKPFAMQGIPPFITMRVDDVVGSGPGATYSFEWIKICNEFGIIPWCGTFNNYILKKYIPTLKSLIDNNRATASPHAFYWNDYIYFNHDNITNPPFDPAARTRTARDFYIQNGLKISKYFIPHYYEVSSAALSEIYAMGGEFIGIHMLPDNLYYMTGASSPWLNCGPYRINRYGTDYSVRPVYYGGYVNLNGIDFFNCITEIRDDSGYEWYPDNDVAATSARGIRQLKRALNSMVLPALFTHERYLENINSSNWREIIRQITSAMDEFNPQYTSMDYAVRYIRAKNNIKITNVKDNPSNIQISYSGNNDLDTRCYLFTENNGQINYRFVVLPQINGNNQVIIPK